MIAKAEALLSSHRSLDVIEEAVVTRKDRAHEADVRPQHCSL